MLRGNIVFSDRKIVVGLLGVSDLIVVETADALLICDRHEAEKIKQLVSRVPAECSRFSRHDTCSRYRSRRRPHWAGHWR